MKWVLGIFVSAIFCCVFLLEDLRLDNGTFVSKINQEGKSKPVQAVSEKGKQRFKGSRSTPVHRHQSSLVWLSPALYPREIPMCCPYYSSCHLLQPLHIQVWECGATALNVFNITDAPTLFWVRKPTACQVSHYYLALGGRVLKWANCLGGKQNVIVLLL